MPRRAVDEHILNRQSLCKIVTRAFKWSCRFIFSRGADVVVKSAERILRICRKLNHNETGDVCEMFAVMVALIYRGGVF